MNKTNSKIFRLVSRYILIVLAGMGNLFIFYKLFSFPTIYLSGHILSIFGEPIILNNAIIFAERLVEITNACVGGSAYYLLFILAMSFPLIWNKRLKLMAYCFGVFFIANVLRIVLMTLTIQTKFFKTIHLGSWYIFSTILVVLIWVSAIRIFKIRFIPFYTDFLAIKDSANAKTNKKNN